MSRLAILLLLPHIARLPPNGLGGRLLYQTAAFYAIFIAVALRHTRVPFLLWGVMPLWWHLMKSVPSFQIVLHRIAWSAVIVGDFNGAMDLGNGSSLLSFGCTPGIICNANAFVIKVDTNGNLVFARTLGGAASSSTEGVAVDAKGDIAISGVFQGDLDAMKVLSQINQSGSAVLNQEQDGSLWMYALDGLPPLFTQLVPAGFSSARAFQV